jgi:hypothetical protein
MNINNPALDILNEIVMATIAHARRDGWKELPDGTLVVGPGFGDLFARDLNVEVASASQFQRGGQVD